MQSVVERRFQGANYMLCWPTPKLAGTVPHSGAVAVSKPLKWLAIRDTLKYPPDQCRKGHSQECDKNVISLSLSNLEMPLTTSVVK